MPQAWNGTLLMYSHTYQQAEPAPQDIEEPNTKVDLVPKWSTSDERLGMVAVDGWARDGVYPAAAVVERAFGDENDYEPDYKSAAWPPELDR